MSGVFLSDTVICDASPHQTPLEDLPAMIRELTEQDLQAILDFAYQREQENLFVIGSFEFLPDPFETNVYLGYIEDHQLVGLGTYFGLWSDIQISTQSSEVLNALVDELIQRDNPVEYVVGFKQYALQTIERLRKHGVAPQVINEETVYRLTPKTFHNHSTGEATKATPADVDEIIRLEYRVEGKATETEVTQTERNRILPDNEWVLRKAGQIISKANIQGFSKHYAQIGGVLTHPEHQSQGYARQTVSAICQHWLDQGKDIILFVKNENAPAIKVYQSLGFQPINEFILAEYV